MVLLEVFDVCIVILISDLLLELVICLVMVNFWVYKFISGIIKRVKSKFFLNKVFFINYKILFFIMNWYKNLVK